MAEQSRKTEWVAVSVVEIDVRHRPTHPDAVDQIAAFDGADWHADAHLGPRGSNPLRPECPDERYVLVTGAHRLAAARLLGWEQIECFKVDCDELDAELWEIAENLHRAELTALQRDEQVARWIELADKKQKVSSQLAKKPQGGRPKEASQLLLARSESTRTMPTAPLRLRLSPMRPRRRLAKSASTTTAPLS